ncbi:hypothetical protein [Flagellimonas iocasae]|uniref:DUF4377 domain-containing protein n=1 Tax=Flagellimonas iocasae TaxID=2055905 RepID=A0ABW4XTV9_9FLAO
MRIFTYIICILLFVSCDGEVEIPVTIIELDVNVNQELRYYLGNNPVEGGYTITKQPKAYSSSEILLDEELGGPTYFYLPKRDFKGLDIVEITLKTSTGNQDFNKELIVLRITVK